MLQKQPEGYTNPKRESTLFRKRSFHFLAFAVHMTSTSSLSWSQTNYPSSHSWSLAVFGNTEESDSESKPPVFNLVWEWLPANGRTFSHRFVKSNPLALKNDEYRCWITGDITATKHLKDKEPAISGSKFPSHSHFTCFWLISSGCKLVTQHKKHESGNLSGHRESGPPPS